VAQRHGFLRPGSVTVLDQDANTGVDVGQELVKNEPPAATGRWGLPVHHEMQEKLGIAADFEIIFFERPSKDAKNRSSV
jgi:hypothetical protein